MCYTLREHSTVLKGSDWAFAVLDRKLRRLATHPRRDFILNPALFDCQ